MTPMPEEPPPRRPRKGGIRHKPGPRPGQKPFDPLSQTWTEQGKSWLAQKARTDRERRVAEAEWLAKHFQLDDKGRLPENEAAQDKGVKARETIRKKLTDFPRINDGELARLEGIIQRYGLPLAAMSSETASFVVRRVMMDFHRLSVLRRALKEPLFTPDELIELMRVLQVKPTQLAEMVAPQNPNNARGSIFRWMHGAAHPTSVLGLKINRLIEQHVRHPKRGGFPGPRKESELVQDGDTARRRRSYRAKKQREAEGMFIPLAPSARKHKEEADAAARQDAGPEVQSGGPLRQLPEGAEGPAE